MNFQIYALAIVTLNLLLGQTVTNPRVALFSVSDSTHVLVHILGTNDQDFTFYDCSMKKPTHSHSCGEPSSNYKPTLDWVHDPGVMEHLYLYIINLGITHTDVITFSKG